MGIFRIFPGKYFITAYYFWTETRNEALLPGKTTILYRKCHAVGDGVPSFLACGSISGGTYRSL